MLKRALANLVEWQCRRSRAGVGDVTLQYASLSFDVAFQELFATWASGGTLLVIPEDARRDLSLLAGAIRDHGVDRIFLPFAALNALATALSSGAAEPAGLPALEVVTAGEQLRVTPAIRAFFEQTGSTSAAPRSAPATGGGRSRPLPRSSRTPSTAPGAASIAPATSDGCVRTAPSSSSAAPTTR